MTKHKATNPFDAYFSRNENDAHNDQMQDIMLDASIAGDVPSAPDPEVDEEKWDEWYDYHRALVEVAFLKNLLDAKRVEATDHGYIIDFGE